MNKEYFDALREQKRLEELFDYADPDYLGVACNLLSAAQERSNLVLKDAKKGAKMD